MQYAMLAALALGGFAVSLYGYYTDPRVRLRRAYRRMARTIGKELIPAFQAMFQASAAAAEATARLAEAMGEGNIIRR